MGKYNCDKCGKEFNQKSHYTTHVSKKNPCIIESKLKEMIDNAVSEKLLQITNTPTKQPSVEIIETTSSSGISQSGGDGNRVEDSYDNRLVKEIDSTKIHITKPFLKWVGGKTQIVDKLIVDFPIEINNYREIFLGGGSVLLALLCYVKQGIIKVRGNVYAHDLNEPLIYIYKNIQTNHIELYNDLQGIITEFNACGNGEVNRTPANIEEAKVAKENYYYWIRREYNRLSLHDKKTTLGSAMFIFLNKTCFRGVFRVGPNGFNVPYGHYNNPEIINRAHLDEIRDLIQNVIFGCSDFTTSLVNVEPNDFVYLDPPYAPETERSFVGYTEHGFTIEKHNSLFTQIHSLTDSQKRIMLSNADVSLVRDNFVNEKYNTLSIVCKRSINSKNPDAKAKEVIIKNY
jgi:DNA adenine methylase